MNNVEELEKKLSSALIKNGVFPKTMGMGNKFIDWWYEGNGIKCSIKINNDTLNINWCKKSNNNEEETWKWKCIQADEDIDDVVNEIVYVIQNY